MDNKRLKPVFVFFLFVSFAFSIDRTVELGREGMGFYETFHSSTMENVVNGKTAGYKQFSYGSVYSKESNTLIAIIKHNFSNGPIVYTGGKLNLAITGKGFFSVVDQHGSRFFTRDGRFELDYNHNLVTISGKFLVLSDQDDPITIADSDSIRIDQDGNIYDVEDVSVAKIKVIDVENKRLLKSLNHVFFYLPESSDSVVESAENMNIKQGYYEGSNVDMTMMMYRMTDKEKYNANTQVVQSRLKLLDTIIDIAKQN
jgi:flagellar basal body rod protein FlgG